MQAARARMMAAVPEADVVVTNPTHFAVALRYDGSRTAPEVIAKGQDMLAAVAVVLVVTMLVVPLPSALLSLLITVNIAAALTVVATTMYLGKALDFASFPSLLLLTTMFRLAINVSVTRLILTSGDAGSVVKSFGEFVVGGNVV